MSHLWHPFADMAAVRASGELLLASGHGSTITDVAGRTYLDATAGLWFANVGHGRTEIAEAMAAQAATLASYSSFGDVAQAVTVQAAETIVARSPHPDGTVFLTSGGSDAVDSAVKLVLAYWAAMDQPDRRIVLHRSGAYHGMHLGGTALAGISANRFDPIAGAVTADEVPWNDAAALEATIARLGPDNVAAFFCEPVQGAGGVHIAPDGYLAEVEAICRRHGVLFVLDEVITGFGRLGRWFAAERFGLTPDLTLFAKGCTSGYAPFAGVIVGPTVMGPFFDEPGRRAWRHGYTYSGHGVASAAALANLAILEQEDLFAAADRLERDLTVHLGPLVELDLVSEVRSGTGAMAAVQIDPEASAADDDLVPQVVIAARERGVLTRMVVGGGLQISPPLVMTTDEVTDMAERLATAIDDVSARR